jgi:type IV secretion system protein VirD4
MTASASQRRPRRLRAFLADRDRTLATLTALVAASAMWPTTAITCAVSAGLIGLGWFLWAQSPTRRLRRELGPDGWLDLHQLRSDAGAAAVRRYSMRPPGTPRTPSQHGFEVGRLVSGPFWMRRQPVYSPHTRGVLVWGPQGSGKSSWLVERILTAPGAAYVSSTKLELVHMTAQQRAQLGSVAVFNPTAMGALASTFGWDPVAGCQDPACADARARALVRGGGGVSGAENAGFWENKAAEIVRCYLLAAALHGGDMGDVMRWALGDEKIGIRILEQYGHQVPDGWLGSLRKNLDAAPNTLSGYMAGVIPAVSFMDNPEVARACRPAPGHHFDIAAFLRDGGTVYVISGEQDRRVAPLLTALTEAVFSAAKQLAAARPAGRLDPPLTLVLDEVANTTPVPLDQWAADSRGWGITVMAVVQDLGQLRARWGTQRAQTIYSNLPTKVVLPGVAVKHDLEDLAYLAGRRTVRQTSEHKPAGQDAAGSRTVSHGREAVIHGDLIYRLPRWHAYVLGLGPRPAVVRFTPGYRLTRRAGRTSAAARLARIIQGVRLRRRSGTQDDRGRGGGRIWAVRSSAGVSPSNGEQEAA